MLTSIHIDILMPVGEQGGVENVVNQVGLHLQEQGFSVRVIQLVWEGVHWVHRSIPFFPMLTGKGQYSLNQFVTQYSKFLEKNGMPDVVLATTWPMMALVAHMSLGAQERKAHKIIAWLHGPLGRYASAGYGGAECLEICDTVFVLNEKSKNLVMSCNVTCNVTIVRNPVSLSKYCLRPEHNCDEKTLLFVGRLSGEKRIDIILHAISFAKSKWRFIVIGDGEERGYLQKLARALHIEKQVTFAGWKTNPWEAASEISALAFASEYESLPLVALESLASGIPVISTPVDGIVEIIKPGINGFLYPFEDSQSLADILDAVAGGILPLPSAQACRNSVMNFEETAVLSDFTQKLMNVLDKISVIIPCYNVEDRIARCLDSILNQDLHGVTIEIVCIDDCSVDNTLQILQQYEQKNPDQILLIPLTENGKQGNARNIGMQYASGNFITFVDADDVIAPQMLREMYRAAVITDCEVVECAYKEIYGDTSFFIEESGVSECMDMKITDIQKKYILKYGWKTAPWGRLYRKNFLLDHNIKFPVGIYMEDIYFSELCMLYMDSYIRIPQTYYFYCLNESGVMLSQGSAGSFMDTMEVQAETTKECLRRGLLTSLEEEFAYLHFSKAFAEPIRRMQENKKLFSYANFLFLKQSLLQFFPHFLDNKYVLNDTSAEMELYKLLLRETFSEQELRTVIGC